MYVGVTNDFDRRKREQLNHIGERHSRIPSGVDKSLVTMSIVKQYKYHKSALKCEDKLIQEYDTINNGWNSQRSGLIWGTTEYKNEHHKKWRNSHREYVREYAKVAMRNWRKKKKEVI